MEGIRIVFWLLGFAFVFAQPVEAQILDRIFNRDKKNNFTPSDPGVPIPVSGNTVGKKGHEIQFEIEAHSKTPGAIVEFLVRDFPIAGRIVSLVSKEGARNKAIVTYWADPNSAATSDAFSFAVRYRGGRYSSAARFDIALDGAKAAGGAAMVQGAKIEVTPDKLDFGKVAVGNETIKEVFVKNKGSKEFNHQLMLYSPWHVIEPEKGQLKLAPGTSQKIKIAFRPALTGPANYLLALNRSKEGLCTLQAQALDPFSFASDDIELIFDPKTRERKAELNIVHHGLKPTVVRILTSERIREGLPPTATLIPGDKNKLEVSLPKYDVAAFEGAIELSLKNGYGKTVNFWSKVVPAELSVEIPETISHEVLNFGKVEAGSTVDRGIILKNLGGEVAQLEFEIPEPFQLVSQPVNQIAPLGVVPFTVGLSPPATQQGAADAVMKIMQGEQVVSIRLLGNVLKGRGGFRLKAGGPAPVPAAPSTAASSATANANPSTSVNRVIPPVGGNSSIPSAAGSGGGGLRLSDAKPTLPEPLRKTDDFEPLWMQKEEAERMAQHKSSLGVPTRPVVNRSIDENLRGAEDLTLVEAKATRLTLGFTSPRDPELYTYEIESRSMAVLEGGGLPENVWMPLQSVEFERINRLVKAEIKNLFPSSMYEFRVITLDNNGKSAPPSEGIVAKTTLPMDWTYIYAGLAVVFLGILGFLIWKVIQQRRGVA